MSHPIDAAIEAMNRIVTHPALSYDAHATPTSEGDRQYQIGVTDGHRCAAEIARAALAGLREMRERAIEGVDVVTGDSGESSFVIVGKETIAISPSEEWASLIARALDFYRLYAERTP